MNEALRIAATVQRAKVLGPLEVLVVDGGSEDGTAEIAAGEACRVIRSERGRAAQQNAGAAEARGEVLLFLHADTWLEPGARTQIEVALRDERVCGGSFRQRIDDEKRIYRLLEWGNAFRAGWLQRPYGDQGIWVRREVFEAVGRFPAVRLMEDVLLAQALRRQGRLALLPGPLHVSARRWQQHGVLRQTLHNWSLLARFKLGVSPDRLAGSYPLHEERT